MDTVPKAPLVSARGSYMHIYLNATLASIDFGMDAVLLSEFKYILAWTVRDGTTIGIGHMITTKTPPTEVEFFEFCAELLTDKEFGIEHDEFMKWTPHVVEIDHEMLKEGD